MQEFLRVYGQNSEKLELYVPVVAKVHGSSHPELADVKQVYDEIAASIKEQNEAAYNFADAFARLRKITDNYRIPEDVCETYEAVYQMLHELDDVYKQSE